MEDKIRYIFITGLPKSGKKTLIKKILCIYNAEIIGFYTEEIFGKKNERIGFNIVNTAKEEEFFAVKHNTKNMVYDYS